MNKRLQSLDALRGFDMFWIMGGEGIIIALAALTGSPVFEQLAKQMHHTGWHGFTFLDLIFPLFLFIAGISFPFSLAKRYADPSKRRSLYTHIVKRGLILVLFGMIYNGLLKFDFENLRVASVLARIGLAWMFAALIWVNTKKTTPRVIWCVGLLVAYWLVAAFVHAPDHPNDPIFSANGSFICYFDRMFLPGVVLGGNFDPEGILSTIPAISTALLGMFTGQFVMLQKEKLSEKRKAGYLALAGIALVLIGLLWNELFPINKKLWSSSFVCFAAGLSTLLFSLFFFVIDVLGWKKWAFFFTVIGLNSITIYMAQSIINFKFTTKFLFSGIIGLFPENWAQLSGSIAYTIVCWLFLYLLYRYKIFLKV